VSVETDAFTQVNHAMNQTLVAHVVELCNPLARTRVLDVFCGAANFSLPAARRGAEVLGIDSDPIAIAAAERNAARLGLTSARFAAQDASEIAKFLLRAGYRPDVVILDPPRSGARELMAPIAKLRPPVVIYVSCDVSTLARDLTLLSSEYDVRSINAFDFFPNTHHFETVAQAVLT
jgi:23S rRNA (uracil1939-C5)-methyltransferase